jgi:hypothetical protein
MNINEINNYYTSDILKALKQMMKRNYPNHKGYGAKKIQLDEEIYSWNQLKRVPKILLVTMAWRLKIEKMDFGDEEE